MRCNSPKNDISLEQIRLALDYDRKTGNFLWKACNRADRNGKPAGTIARDGYVRIKIGQRAYAAHRLAWLITYREWPTQQIDHINRIRTDNRIENLCDASPAENSRNRKKQDPYRRAGTKGCTFIERLRKWQAQISVQGTKQKRYLGVFETETEAKKAYQTALNETMR